MYYKIYKQSTNYYYIKHHKDIYDINGIDKRIPKWKFLSWATNKIDLTDYSKIKQIETTECTTNTCTLSPEQKIIMDYVSKTVLEQGYILESSISIDEYSKRLVRATTKNEDILDAYKLKRTRATKKLKKKLGITSKGYPFIIVGCSYV